ncbi:MAG: hypothetical protein LBF78_07505 [Treponema sp.]|nr:hypothetical protein [Treponema sp.]
MDECLIDYVAYLARSQPWGGRIIKKWDFDLYKARLNGKKVFVWETPEGEAEARAEGKGQEAVV